MTQAETKKRVTVMFYESSRQYKGRLLGLITEEEFVVLLNSRTLQNKFFTSPTISIKDIGNNYDHLDGMRLVVAVKERKNQPVGRELFVSDKLLTVSYCNKDEIGIAEDGGGFILLREEEVTKDA